jgi:hypothetical protein
MSILTLANYRYITVEHQLHMFLSIVTNSASTRTNASRFQHSSETVNRYFNRVLDALDQISSEYITLPTSAATLAVPAEITTNPKFYPYFKDCIGAIDGSLIPVSIRENEASVGAYRCRKGFLAQNVLAVCSFDLTFQYILAGWEGAANDGRVLEDALQKGFTIPTDKYYLADAGYGLTPNFLTPYRGVRYHLKEFAQGTQRPQNAKEIFNLRHASLRNAIERIFGVLKKRFPILKKQCEYKLGTQVKLVKALCCLHNFIRINGGLDEYYNQATDSEPNSIDDDGNLNLGRHLQLVEPVTRIDRGIAKEKRDKIAEKIWQDYLRHIRYTS